MTETQKNQQEFQQRYKNLTPAQQELMKAIMNMVLLMLKMNSEQ